MEKKEIFVLHLPNIGMEEVFKLSEQLIIQNEKLMDGYRIETDKLILDIIIKKS
jgi:hypothetical protein